jgi:hypothetical protein
MTDARMEPPPERDAGPALGLLVSADDQLVRLEFGHVPAFWLEPEDAQRLSDHLLRASGQARVARARAAAEKAAREKKR